MTPLFELRKRHSVALGAGSMLAASQGSVTEHLLLL